MGTPAIVTTTINKRPASFERWAQQGELIVAGDLNTPPELADYVLELGGHYLAPIEPFPGSKHVPFRCIQRRNQAIWRAYVGQWAAVITVDDDNSPAQGYFAERLTDELDRKSRSTVSGKSGFLNLGELCIPKFHQRGTPYGVDTRLGTVTTYDENQSPTVVVAQAMVIGDPDCDAIERIVHHPDVKALQNRIVVTPGTYAAFNSQATAWSHRWVPAMAVLPYCGRYDDIFASFIFARLARTYNVALYAGDPVVIQERNEHDLTKDLAAEYYGMSIVFEFCAALDRAHISATMPIWMSYGELIEAVAHLLPEPAVLFAREWVRSWRDNE